MKQAYYETINTQSFLKNENHPYSHSMGNLKIGGGEYKILYMSRNVHILYFHLNESFSCVKIYT